MTLKEARMEQSPEKTHGIAAWRKNCGPNGDFYVFAPHQGKPV
jgi:hypothetical protein